MPKARPSPVGRTVARNWPLRASISCTDCMARICGGAVAGGRFGQAAEQEGVVEQHDAAGAQVVGRPVEVGRIALLVGVDEHQVERPARRQRAAGCRRHADVDAGARGDAGAAEALARDLGVPLATARWCPARRRAPSRAATRRPSSRPAFRSRPPCRAPAARASTSRCRRVQRRDLDVGQARRGAALADLRQHFVLGRVHARDVFGQLRIAVAERLVHVFTLPSAESERQQRLEQHEHDRRRPERVPQLQPPPRRRTAAGARARAIRALVVREAGGIGFAGVERDRERRVGTLVDGAVGARRPHAVQARLVGLVEQHGVPRPRLARMRGGREPARFAARLHDLEAPVVRAQHQLALAAHGDRSPSRRPTATAAR